MTHSRQLRSRAMVVVAVLASLVAACNPELPHAPTTEHTGIDEEILVAVSEQSAGEPIGARGRALLTVLQLRDRATPDVQLEVDVWLRAQLSTFQQMSTVERLPPAAPYHQAERAYGEWVTTAHPEEHDEFATDLYNLPDGVLAKVDRQKLAITQLTVKPPGRASYAALQYLERPKSAASFHAALIAPKNRARLRTLLAHALGGEEPMREVSAASHCHSAAAWPTMEEQLTFLGLWREVATDEASWDEGVRVLADIRVAPGSIAMFASPLINAWHEHPERRGAVLFAIASLVDTGDSSTTLPFAEVFDALDKRTDFTPMLTFDPRAVLVLPRILDEARALPKIDAFVAGLATLHTVPADTRLRDARDPSIVASVASYASHLCVSAPRQTSSSKLQTLKNALANDLVGTDANLDQLFKCTSKVTLTTAAAIARHRSDC